MLCRIAFAYFTQLAVNVSTDVITMTYVYEVRVVALEEVAQDAGLV